MAATPNKQFKNICVLSGFNYGKYKEFVKVAIDLGRSIAREPSVRHHPNTLKPLRCLFDSPTGEELVVSAKKVFICAHTTNELLDLLQAYQPEPDPRTFVLEYPNNDGNSNRSKKYKLDLTLYL
ncbi:hypothetical protein WN943_015549 [Citrus x changshan-huyou]